MLRTFLLMAVLTGSALSQIDDTVAAILDNITQIINSVTSENGIKLPTVEYNVPSVFTILFSVFDFIIVGAGAAGALLANRLSENKKWNVLLIEAGTQGDPISDIPLLAGLQQFYKAWPFLMEPQDNCCKGMTDQRMNAVRGKALGGSTLINMMMATRGNRNDYDRWAKQGNLGWSYADILPYFKSLENSTVAIEDTAYRGSKGGLTVEDVAFRTLSAGLFVSACENLGYPYVDYNGANQMGVSYLQAMTRNGLRCSSEKAFLRPAKHRSNLFILTNSFVKKILINSRNAAYGVQFENGGHTYTVRATKEVILSAGAINSPHLLMLSGIGPQKDLRKVGIPVIKDLPVGRLLYDHLSFPGLVYTVNDSRLTYHLTDAFNPNSYYQLYKQANGPLTDPGCMEGLAFYQTNPSKKANQAWPDFEFMLSAGHMNTDKGMFERHFFRYTDEIYDLIWKPLEDKNALGIIPLQLHPLSRGNLTLNSADPHDPPKIYGNYLTHPQDVKSYIAAIREAQRIMNSPEFLAYDIQQVDYSNAICTEYEFDTDEFYECALSYLASTLFHLTSTCKMGPASDPQAVVDNRLKVYGIQNLRVIDASVVPVTISGHTTLVSYLVGAKGAAMIKKDWS